MSAIEALRDGDLDRALAKLQDEVRAHPEVSRHRIFLFQLLAVLGQWPRALTQLQVIGELDAGAIAMVRTYQEVIRCELLRRSVFAGERSPMILGDPEPWMAQLVEALRISHEGDVAAAQKLREQAFESAPTTAGTLSIGGDPAYIAEVRDQPFAWMADADSRLGPVLEAIVNGRYYWVPFQRIARIELTAPEDLRDLVWMPAHFQWANQGEAVGVIPTRYPGSETHHDPQIRLAKRTEWLEPIADVYEGIGQRLLATDDGEYAIMNLRQIQFVDRVG